MKTHIWYTEDWKGQFLGERKFSGKQLTQYYVSVASAESGPYYRLE